MCDASHIYDITCTFLNDVYTECVILLLQNLTEHRVQSFSNEVVPNYLRTKPEPATEEKERNKQKDVGQVSQELALVSESHCQMLTVMIEKCQPVF